MVFGQKIICLKTKISEEDFTWTALRSTGISEVYHLPSLPLTKPRDEVKPLTTS